jgi:hypothetical protein
MLSYCILCWVFGVGLRAWITRHLDCDSAALMVPGLAWRWHAFQYLTVIAMPILVPLIGLWMIWQFARCVHGQLQIIKVGKRYREPSFRMVDASDLDRDIADQLDEATAAYLELGFRWLGDFQTKSDPVPVYNRYLIGYGGAVIGDITVIFGECGSGFMSVLEDGTYVETATTEPCNMPGELTPSDFLCVNMAGIVPLADAFGVHRAALERECESRRTRLLEFRDDQLREVAVYGQRRFWTWRKCQGDATGDVAVPVLPTGSAVAPEVLWEEIHAG